MQDDTRELDETFTIVLTGRGSPGGTDATVELQATIAGNGEILTLEMLLSDGGFEERLRVEEGGGPGEEGDVEAVFRLTLTLDGLPVGRGADFSVSVEDRSAKVGEDYEDVDGTDGNTWTLIEGVPEEFAIEILDDVDSEGAESFAILLESVVGTTTSYTKEFQVNIVDNDGPDPILREIGRHVVAWTEVLIENQPRLIPMLRNPGLDAAEFSLRLTDDGVDAAGGGFQGETLWGATTLSRATDGHGEHEHLLATLGAHARMSERLHLGGMLQFDRSGTRPGGEVVFGEIR